MGIFFIPLAPLVFFLRGRRFFLFLSFFFFPFPKYVSYQLAASKSGRSPFFLSSRPRPTAAARHSPLPSPSIRGPNRPFRRTHTPFLRLLFFILLIDFLQMILFFFYLVLRSRSFSFFSLFPTIFSCCCC